MKRLMKLNFILVILPIYLASCNGTGAGTSDSGAALTSIQITPANPVMAKGTITHLAATGVYSDNTSKDITSLISWNSANTGIATIGNSGEASAVTAGTALITASYGPVSGSTTVTVTAALLTSITVTPASPSSAIGFTRQFSAIGTYSDDSSQDITFSVNWSSSSASVASIGNAPGSFGLATSFTVGTTSITATDAATNLIGSTTLTVTSATLTAVTITPTNPNIALGLSRQFTSTGLFSDGTTRDVAESLLWSSSTTSVATISNSAGTRGKMTSLATGSTTITAADPATGVSASTTLTIVAQTPVKIFVSESANNRIVQMSDMTGLGWTAEVFSRGSGTGQINVPYGFFVDATEKIFIADYANNRIVRQNDLTGSGWTTFGSNGSGPGQFNLPGDIFVDSAGKIYVADSYNNRIVRMDDMMGTGWIALGNLGSGINQFVQPIGITVDKTGRIYVADQGNNRIVRVDDMMGSGWIEISCIGSCTDPFSLPYGVRVDSENRIYVTDLMNGRIVRMDDMLGNGWISLGSTGSGMKQFNNPIGISIAPDGRIYVSDSGNNRIVQIDDMTGSGWTSLGSWGTGTNQFYAPIRVVVQ